MSSSKIVRISQDLNMEKKSIIIFRLQLEALLEELKPIILQIENNLQELH